ncbi:MAG: hypothetical protein IPM29_24425 [Planctomycetes bacterium]|nr:hypothetical protein [Planctomycetota bacterium]
MEVPDMEPRQPERSRGHSWFDGSDICLEQLIELPERYHSKLLHDASDDWTTC